MKKYKVKQSFTDKETKRRYDPGKPGAKGAEYESDDAKRVKFLQDGGFLGEEIKEKKKEDDAEKKKAADKEKGKK